MKEKKFEDTILGGKYQLDKLIGEGAFGKIYSARCIETQTEVAVKIEKVNKKRSQLLNEAKVLKLLQGATGITRLDWVATVGEYNVMAMELLGQSLETILKQLQHAFSLGTILVITEQIIERIENFHNKGFLHRDIKPDNFVVGRGKTMNTVYMIDFGLAKRFRNPKTKLHIPMKEGKKLTGTARFASLNTHLGMEQGRRDDIEGALYTILYLARQNLPWQGVKGETKKEKEQKIMEIKMKFPIEELCKGLPIEFSRSIYYIRGLQFEDKPDYNKLKKQFKDCFLKNHLSKNFKFDWETLGSSPIPKTTIGEEEKNVNVKRKSPKAESIQMESEYPNPKVVSNEVLLSACMSKLTGIILAAAAGVGEKKQKAAINSPPVPEDNNETFGPKRELFELEEAKKEPESKRMIPGYIPTDVLCNFESRDLIEDVTLLDETIPSEKPIQTTIKSLQKDN